MVEIMLVYQERCHLEYDDIGEMWGQGSYPGALPSCSQVPICWDFGGALGGWSAPGHHLLPRPLVIPGSGAGEVWWSIISGLLSSQRLCIFPSRLTLNKLPQFFTLKSNRGQSNLRRSRTTPPPPPPCFFFSLQKLDSSVACSLKRKLNFSWIWRKIMWLYLWSLCLQLISK